MLNDLRLGRRRPSLAREEPGILHQSGAVVRVHGLGQSLVEQRPLIG